MSHPQSRPYSLERHHIATSRCNHITALYDVSISDTDVILTAKAPASNVSNLNIALSNGTCAGLTAVSTSANTIAGVATVKQQEHIYVTGTIQASKELLITVHMGSGVLRVTTVL